MFSQIEIGFSSACLKNSQRFPERVRDRRDKDSCWGEMIIERETGRRKRGWQSSKLCKLVEEDGRHTVLGVQAGCEVGSGRRRS